MTRRSLFSALLGLTAAACNELRRYHSSVRFSVSTEAPAAGEPVEVSFDYLDDLAGAQAALVLLRANTGEEVDRAPVTDASTRARLTPPTPGAYSIQFQRDGRMVAHRAITAR